MIAFRTLAQLVRLPNLPTAIADIALAALATDSLPVQWFAFLLLAIASCCLYMGGMVWNDFFDAAKDRKERPERPIPSGRVPRKVAGWIGAILVALGLVFACLAGLARVQEDGNGGMLGPLLMAICLTLAIFAYDGWLKKTAMGPVAMGSCRFFNVLMGITLSGGWAWPLGPTLALAVGTYIVGVTWFARTEAIRSNQRALAGAAGVMLLGVLLGLVCAALVPEGKPSPLFVYLLAGLTFWVGLPLVDAIRKPVPGNVQKGVKRSLMGLIALDAILACGVAGTAGLILLVLLLPSIYLNRQRWLYAT
ncbi:MAG: UbiA family prenyltransferase [Gemmataceae bacterium]